MGPEKAAPCGIQALRRVRNAQTKAAFLMTQCKAKPVEFHALGSREVVAHFDGGDITSDAGGLMLRTIRFTDIKKDDSSMGTMTATAICRCTSSAGSFCSALN